MNVQELAAGQSTGKEKESFCSQTAHRKVLDKGVPEDAIPGIKGIKVRTLLLDLLYRYVCLRRLTYDVPVLSGCCRSRYHKCHSLAC